MSSVLKSWARQKLHYHFASQPNQKGIKFLLRLHDRVYSHLLGAIKVNEGFKGGIHPKHWATDFHKFFLNNIEPGDTVLEIGCAYGHIANSIAGRAKNVMAVDNRAEAIGKAQELFNRANLSFVCSDFFMLNQPDHFDVVILSNVLEHIRDREAFLRKAAAIGKKLLVRVPAYDRDWMVPYKESLGLEWRLSEDHEIEYREEQLRKELEQAGLEIDSLFSQWGNYCCVARRRTCE